MSRPCKSVFCKGFLCFSPWWQQPYKWAQGTKVCWCWRSKQTDPAVKNPSSGKRNYFLIWLISMSISVTGTVHVKKTKTKKPKNPKNTRMLLLCQVIKCIILLFIIILSSYKKTNKKPKPNHKKPTKPLPQKKKKKQNHSHKNIPNTKEKSNLKTQRKISLILQQNL